MRGACMNTFHLFHAAGDSLVINHSLLCQGVTLYGPGILYNLRFRASTTPQGTEVRIRYVEFYDAGIYARPVVVANSGMSIGPPVDVAPDGAGSLRLEAAPNPFRPATVLRVETGLSGRQSLTVRDARGRALRVLERGHFGPGARWILWDGRDAGGVRLASGVYWVTLEANGLRLTRRVVLVK
jgi:hypothetical protein